MAYNQTSTLHRQNIYDYIANTFNGYLNSFKLTSASVAEMFKYLGFNNGFLFFNQKRYKYYGFGNSEQGNTIRVFDVDPINQTASISATNDGTTSGAVTIGQNPIGLSLSSFDQTAFCGTVTTVGFGIFNHVTSSHVAGRFQNIFSGQTNCNRLAGSASGNVWVFGGVGGTLNTRLYICRHGLTPMNFAYIDTPLVTDALITDTLSL
jgi:hypothetical protein